MTESTAKLREQQFAFARHLRDASANAPPPGIEERRLAVYRELFYNNIDSLLAGGFPVIRKTLGDTRWHAVVRAFHAGHRCRTPLFTEVGREFIDFLQSHDDDAHPPWLAELAHYEWVEMALQVADDPVPPHDPIGNLLEGVPVVSPFAWPLAYRWPVSRIGPGFEPVIAPQQPTLLLVRRDADGRVRFAEISALVYRLLVMPVEMPGCTGRDILLAMSKEAAAKDPQQFVADGLAMLQRLRDEGSILGTAQRAGEQLASARLAR